MKREVLTTLYFREQVLRKRPYIHIGMCLAVLDNYYRIELQPDGRVRFWGYVPELQGKALRVITLEDRITLHNAFQIVLNQGGLHEAALL